MSLPWNVNASMGGAGVNYQIQRSLRFRASASAYLSRTPASNGNQTKWTVSFWYKPGRFGSQQPIITSYTGVNNYALIGFSLNAFINASDTFKFYVASSGTTQVALETTSVYRDPSAWYHVVVAVDTTQATSTNRVLIYVNGVQVTSFSTATYPSLNASLVLLNTTNPQQIGALATGTYGYYDGYMAEFNWIDGQQLTPASFGYNDPVTGVWQPAPFKGTYGTNGFYLPFTDIATTSGSNFGLGRDYSGNANYFNTNNISVTSGATYDSMIDSPTNFSDGSTYYNRGNYAVLNPLNKGTNQTVTNGNLTNTASGHGTVLASIGVTSGLWYCESTLTVNGPGGIGITSNLAAESSYTNVSGKWWCYDNTGNFIIANQTTTTSYATRFSAGQVWQWAIDNNNGKVWIGVNNAWLDSTNGTTGNPSTGANPTFTFTAGTLIWPFLENAGGPTWNANFGQQPFSYTPPTGFKALNTFNLPTPTIANGAAYMAATLYSGDGTNGRSISNGLNNPIGVTFQPDLSWLKQRNGTFDNRLDNSIITGYRLVSNSTAAEASNFGAFSLTSTGISVSASINDNNSGSNYVAWQWKAGAGTTSTNTSGSITSTVSVSTQSGFSVVTYTGTGANATVGHGLGVAPSMYIVKCRSNAGTQWPTYHVSMGATKAMNLDATSGAITYNLFWNNTAPTSSVFSIGSVGADTNINGATFVAYCFAAVSGYSAFGSYTGNGSTDGPFVYTNFRPRYVMWKRSDSTGDWIIQDTSRATYNASDTTLYANLSAAESVGGGYSIDVLSNGFKMRTAATYANASGGTYIYAAFAENPFNYSRAR